MELGNEELLNDKQNEQLQKLREDKHAVNRISS